MKTINITLTDRAHTNLKTITESTKKNQSEIVSEILERTDMVRFIKEMKA